MQRYFGPAGPQYLIAKIQCGQTCDPFPDYVDFKVANSFSVTEAQDSSVEIYRLNEISQGERDNFIRLNQIQEGPKLTPEEQKEYERLTAKLKG